MQPDKIEKLKQIVNVLREDVPSTTEVAKLVAKIIEAVKAAQAQMQQDMKKNMNECSSMCQDAEQAMQESTMKLSELVSTSLKQNSDKWYKELNNEVYKIEKTISELEKYDDTQIEAKFTAVISDISSRIDNIKPFIPTAIETRDLLESLSGDERLDATAIKGLDKHIKTTVVNQGGGTMGIQLSVDSVLKGISKYVNFVAGSGITLTPTSVGESTVITVSAVSGGGSETPTGDMNQGVFTFVRSPKVIIVDQGRTFVLNNGFTLDSSGLVATLDTYPTFSIFSI